MESRKFFCLAKVTPHNLLLCGGALIQVDAHSKVSTVALHKASLQLNGLSVTRTHSQQVHGKMLNIISHQGDTNQNHSEILLHNYQNGYYPKPINDKCL